jgi:hypothetical protein
MAMIESIPFDRNASASEPEWDFHRMYEDVCQYAQQVQARFTEYPHTARELGHLFGALESGLSSIILWEGREPFIDPLILHLKGRVTLNSRQKTVKQTINDFDESIDELPRNFEVTDTGVLERVRDQLINWLAHHGPTPELSGPRPAPM